mmetsp:Transcript_4890/g.19574  ORF Transcript_4890/g.19574 Transcript_4890/m.19574 type:complete len:259 (+) Transcript_4890:756-1532(+)
MRHARLDDHSFEHPRILVRHVDGALGADGRAVQIQRSSGAVLLDEDTGQAAHHGVHVPSERAEEGLSRGPPVAAIVNGKQVGVHDASQRGREVVTVSGEIRVPPEVNKHRPAASPFRLVEAVAQLDRVAALSFDVDGAVERVVHRAGVPLPRAGGQRHASEVVEEGKRLLDDRFGHRFHVKGRQPLRQRNAHDTGHWRRQDDSLSKRLLAKAPDVPEPFAHAGCFTKKLGDSAQTTPSLARPQLPSPAHRVVEGGGDA